MTPSNKQVISLLTGIKDELCAIRELLASQPGVPHRLWTEARWKAEEETQASRQEVARSYAFGHGGIVLVNTPLPDGSYGPGGDGVAP